MATRKHPSDVAFSPAVKTAQQERGSRLGYAKMEMGRGWRTTVTPDLADFIAGLDMFYLGTASASGQPYIQYRGGAPGFLRVLDERTLGFADFSGNKQYITVGNLSENPRAFIFLMDYVNQRRVKIWGSARIVENDPGLFSQLDVDRAEFDVERAIVFTIEAWDVNCPQHIHRRLLLAQVGEVIERLERRIAELEAQLGTTPGDAARPDLEKRESP